MQQTQKEALAIINGVSGNDGIWGSTGGQVKTSLLAL